MNLLNILIKYHVNSREINLGIHSKPFYITRREFQNSINKKMISILKENFTEFNKEFIQEIIFQQLILKKGWIIDSGALAHMTPFK